MSETSHDQPSPDRPGHEGFIPYLILSDADEALRFYTKAFGATETMRLAMPDGTIAHAEMRIDGHPVYLADESPEMVGGPTQSPSSAGTTTVILHRYVADVDAVVEQARGAGATILKEPTDEFYGDRAATIQDPWGHQWSVHTRVRVVTLDEMQEAMTG